MEWIHFSLLIVTFKVAGTNSQEGGIVGNTCEDIGTIRLVLPPPPPPPHQPGTSPPTVVICGEEEVWELLLSERIRQTNICAALNDIISVCGHDEESSGGRSSTIALGVITGILVVALVMVIVGWVGTCCFVLKKKKGKSTDKDSQARSTVDTTPQQSYHNLVHSKPPGLPQATYYSSLGPDYEVVDKRRSPQPQRVEQSTNVTKNKAAIDHDYHVLEGKTVDHTYHELEIGSDSKLQPIRAAPGPVVGNKEKEASAATYELPVTSKNRKDEK